MVDAASEANKNTLLSIEAVHRSGQRPKPAAGPAGRAALRRVTHYRLPRCESWLPHTTSLISSPFSGSTRRPTRLVARELYKERSTQNMDRVPEKGRHHSQTELLTLVLQTAINTKDGPFSKSEPTSFPDRVTNSGFINSDQHKRWIVFQRRADIIPRQSY